VEVTSSTLVLTEIRAKQYTRRRRKTYWIESQPSATARPTDRNHGFRDILQNIAEFESGPGHAMTLWTVCCSLPAWCTVKKIAAAKVSVKLIRKW